MKESKKEINKRECYALKWNGKKQSANNRIRKNEKNKLYLVRLLANSNRKYYNLTLAMKRRIESPDVLKSLLQDLDVFILSSKSKCFINVLQSVL